MIWACASCTSSRAARAPPPPICRNFNFISLSPVKSTGLTLFSWVILIQNQRGYQKCLSSVFKRAEWGCCRRTKKKIQRETGNQGAAANLSRRKVAKTGTRLQRQGRRHRIYPPLPISPRFAFLIFSFSPSRMSQNPSSCLRGHTATRVDCRTFQTRLRAR